MGSATYLLSSFVTILLWFGLSHYEALKKIPHSIPQLTVGKSSPRPDYHRGPPPPTQRRPTRWGGSVFCLLLFVQHSLCPTTDHLHCRFFYSRFIRSAAQDLCFLFGLNLCSFCFACAFSSCCVVLPSFVFHQP